MRYVAWDIHKNYHYVLALDEDGDKVFSEKFENTSEAIRGFIVRLSKDDLVVLEATTHCYAIYDMLVEKEMRVVVAHLGENKKARIKNDERDMLKLAQKLRAGILELSYVPSREMRSLRSLTRHRIGLGQRVAVAKNRALAVLARNGVKSPCKDAFGKAGVRFMQCQSLPGLDSALLQSELRIIEGLKREIGYADVLIAKAVKGNPQAELLMSIWGCSFYGAAVILAEIGDVQRFPSAKHLCSYAGLVPSLEASGTVERTGRITKRGSRVLRWIMLQVARTAVRQRNSRIRGFYTRIMRKKGDKKAIVACARKLLSWIYAMLTRGVRYNEESERLTLAKIGRLDGLVGLEPVSMVSGAGSPQGKSLIGG